MKKLLILILGLAMVISFFACSSQQNEQKNEEEQSSVEHSKTQSAAPRGIAGSHATDIRLGLTKFGLEEASTKSAPEEAKAIFARSASTSYKDSNTGVSYSYSLTMDSDYQIIGASFDLSTDLIISNDDFIRLAENYLGFCATMPYESFDPETVRMWTDESIPAVADGEPQRIIIGDAKFELYGESANGTYLSFWLDISKVSED